MITKSIYVVGPTEAHDYNYVDASMYNKMKKIVVIKLKKIIKEEECKLHFIMDGEPFAGHILLDILKSKQFENEMSPKEYTIYLSSSLIELKRKKYMLIKYQNTLRVSDSLNEKFREFRLAIKGSEPLVDIFNLKNKKIKENEYLRMSQILREADILISFQTREPRSNIVPKKDTDNLKVYRYTQKMLSAYSGMSTSREYDILMILKDKLQDFKMEDWRELRKDGNIDGGLIVEIEKLNQLL